MIAKIAVSAANFAIDKPYSYAFPQEMELVPGVRVLVPFGRSNRPSEGVVLSVETGEESGLKPVTQVMDSEPVLSPTMLHLAAFLRERCFCTFFDAIRAMLPTGLWYKTKDTYTLTEDQTWRTAKFRQEDGAMVLDFLASCGGSATGEKLHTVLPDEERLQKALAYLRRKKWISSERSFNRKAGDKTQKLAALAVPAEQAMAYAASRPKSSAMQKAVLELMCSVGSASVKEICYYTGCGPTTVNRLADLGYLTLSEKAVLRCREIRPSGQREPIELSAQQQEAFEGLKQQMDSPEPGGALLYGVTGSGKTAVYIKLIEHCLAQGRQAVLLVPEIALTPQLLGLLAAYFTDRVGVLHSSLPVGERYDHWKRIQSGKADVVVGTRSAVFAPCPNPGLIILDEEQEHSYQSENNPRYSAREVALWRGFKEKALVLLGSATPSVETMYHARCGRLRLYHLQQRFGGKPLPRVEIVDMKKQLQLGNGLSLSYDLQDSLRETADGGKQTILFLNRRGNSRSLMCVDCGEVPECPRCSARLTYHSANGRLMCHYCGYSQKAPERCPRCGGPMKTQGTGTQKVQQELEGVFPDLEVIRMDADTVTVQNSHEVILDRFQRENIPVLVGTQMVVKGLNLPDVTLVGVLDADLSLYTENFRAAETTFNMLTQVVGRAGRGDTPGRAIIQTMVPEHKVITLAARQDYDSFYGMEIEMRRVQHLPPFGDIAMLVFTGQDEAQLLRGAMKLKNSLTALLSGKDYIGETCTVLGPAPCPVPKINYHYRYRLTLRCSMTRKLRILLAHLLRQFSQDRDNRGVTVYADVNGYD